MVPQKLFALDSDPFLPAKFCSALLNWMTVKFFNLLAPISYLWMLTPMFLHIYNGGGGNYYGIWFQRQPNIFHSKYGNWSSSFKNLIENKCKNLEKMMKKRKKQLILSLLSKKLILKMMKMLLNLSDQVYKKKAIKILLWLTLLRVSKSKLMRKIKKKTGGLFYDYGIVLREEKKIRSILK